MPNILSMKSMVASARIVRRRCLTRQAPIATFPEMN
jgi:hypothetical protein